MTSIRTRVGVASMISGAGLCQNELQPLAQAQTGVVGSGDPFDRGLGLPKGFRAPSPPPHQLDLQWDVLGPLSRISRFSWAKQV